EAHLGGARRRIDAHLAGDVRARIAGAAELAPDRALHLVVVRLVEARAFLQRGAPPHTVHEVAAEHVGAVEVDARDEHGLALLDVDVDPHGAATPLVGVAAGGRLLGEAIALRGLRRAEARAGDLGVVVAARPVPALDALHVALPDVEVEHRPLRHGPGPELHGEPSAVEGRIAALEVHRRAERELEAIALLGREAGLDGVAVHRLRAVDPYALHAVALGRDVLAAGGHEERRREEDAEVHGSRRKVEGETRSKAPAGTSVRRIRARGSVSVTRTLPSAKRTATVRFSKRSRPR